MLLIQCYSPESNVLSRQVLSFHSFFTPTTVSLLIFEGLKECEMDHYWPHRFSLGIWSLDFLEVWGPVPYINPLLFPHWKVNPANQNTTHLSLQTMHGSKCLEAKDEVPPFLSNWVITTSAVNKDKVISSVFRVKHIIWLDFICVREFYPSLHTMQRTCFLSLILNFPTINFIDWLAGFQIKEK